MNADMKVVAAQLLSCFPTPTSSSSTSSCLMPTPCSLPRTVPLRVVLDFLNGFSSESEASVPLFFMSKLVSVSSEAWALIMIPRQLRSQPERTIDRLESRERERATYFSSSAPRLRLLPAFPPFLLGVPLTALRAPILRLAGVDLLEPGPDLDFAPGVLRFPVFDALTLALIFKRRFEMASGVGSSGGAVLSLRVRVVMEGEGKQRRTYATL